MRLDLLASTLHDRLAAQDYRQLAEHGIRTVRDGVRWHQLEPAPRRYVWSGLVAMLRAARATGTQVVWDLCHYGCPDHVDVWSAAFPDAFAAFAAAAARVVRDETPGERWYCPINEISYWAWAGGEVARMDPWAEGQGARLKRQLVRAAIAAIERIRSVDSDARFLLAEPLIHVVPGACDGVAHDAAARHRDSQFEVHDLLSGRREPELGGRREYLDLVGVNFYPENQWYHGGSTIPLGHHAYRPLAELLGEVGARYGRPLLVSETGAEGRAKGYWLHHVCGEVVEALARNVPIEGICLYPVLDYAGWENDRPCDVGLLGAPDAEGRRRACPLLAEEVRVQLGRFERLALRAAAPARSACG